MNIEQKLINTKKIKRSNITINQSKLRGCIMVIYYFHEYVVKG